MSVIISVSLGLFENWCSSVSVVIPGRCRDSFPITTASRQALGPPSLLSNG